MNGNKIMVNCDISAAQMAGRVKGGEGWGGHIRDTEECHICENKSTGIKRMEGKAGTVVNKTNKVTRRKNRLNGLWRAVVLDNDERVRVQYELSKTVIDTLQALNLDFIEET
jgi:hypothetical protein